MIDLMLPDIKRKKLNYKHIIFTVIILIIIGISIFLCIQSVKRNNTQIAMENETNNNTNTQIVNTENVNQEEVKPSDNVIYIIDDKKIANIANNTLISSMQPRLTENAKEKMKHIYASDYKRVFLTFDDGPSKNVTPQILDILKQNNVKATFFVLGNRVDLYPNILKREYDEGHYIANHGYSHQYSSIYANPYNVLDEFNKTEYSIRNAIGNQSYNSHLFRFPGGASGGKYAAVKKEAIALLEQNGIMHVDWSALTKDAEGKFTKEQLIQNLYDTVGTKQSVVLLMHDAGDKQTTVEALQDVINYFRAQGYVFENFYDIMK